MPFVTTSMTRQGTTGWGCARYNGRRGDFFTSSDGRLPIGLVTRVGGVFSRSVHLLAFDCASARRRTSRDQGTVNRASSCSATVSCDGCIVSRFLNRMKWTDTPGCLTIWSFARLSINSPLRGVTKATTDICCFCPVRSVSALTNFSG